MTVTGNVGSASTEADVRAIRATFEEYADTMKRGDAAGWQTFFTEDVVSMAPNEPAVIGREALQAWGQPYFDSFDMEEPLSPQEIVVVGDWAFARMSYTFRLTPNAGGAAIQDSVKESASISVSQTDLGRLAAQSGTATIRLWVSKPSADP